MEELAVCAVDTERTCDESNKEMDKMEGGMDKVGTCVCVHAYECVSGCTCVCCEGMGTYIHVSDPLFPSSLPPHTLCLHPHLLLIWYEYSWRRTSLRWLQTPDRSHWLHFDSKLT